MPNDDRSVLRATDVTVTRDRRTIIDRVSLVVNPGERWVIIGQNGCGKTTLLRILSLYLHPSRGDIAICGQSLGTVDIRPIRRRIAYMSAGLASDLRSALTAVEVVVTAKNAALEPWWHEYDNADRARALECLARMSVDECAHRAYGTLSSGEQQRVLLARAMMNDPVCLLLDEPTARLDLGGREHFIGMLDEIACANPLLPSITVTHHVDEIPVTTTHMMMMKLGRSIFAGPLEEVLTSENLSKCFGMPLEVSRATNGRFSAFAR